MNSGWKIKCKKRKKGKKKEIIQRVQLLIGGKLVDALESFRIVLLYSS